MLADIARIIEEARRAAARSVNVVMTTTCWLVGRRIVEQEQHGATRAAYGEQLLKQLSRDLSKRFGRGFSERNLEQMRIFCLGWPISQTPSAKSLPATPGPRGVETSQTPSEEFPAGAAGATRPRFPPPWSHYVPLLAVKNPHARDFYEVEALRGGWSVSSWVACLRRTAS